MSEVILFEPDPETRLLLRSLLERDGFEVTEADSVHQATDIARASRAQALLMTAHTRAACAEFVDELERTRPDLDVLAPVSFGAALLDGGAQRDSVAEFARDALLLMAVLSEEATRFPPAAEKLGRLAELTALRMGLSRLQVEACSSGAALVALGPTLVAFRFGLADEATNTMASQHSQGAEGGVGKDVQAAMAAAAALRCPYDLRGIIEAVEERFDGRGRPSGLRGGQIPLASRVIAVAREYSMLVAEGQEEVVATELVRSRAGSDYDPKVVDAFFRALRDENYVTRLESGKRGARVLYVDPDAAACAVAELRLNAAGFSVQVCDDGQRAFEAISADPPDVIISETALPRMDGISLLLKLRRDPTTQQVPLIFVSARTDAGLLNKALKLGAKDVIAKPVNYDVLVAKLRTLASGAVAAAQKSGAAQGAVQGDLAEMPLTDFFQVLSLGRKTVKVVVASPSGQGQLFFERGAPVAAYTPKTRGMDAFAQIIGWSQGTFSLVMGEIAPERNLDPSFQNMLFQLSAGAPTGSGGHGSGGHGSGGHGSAHGESYQGPGMIYAPPPSPATLHEDDPYGAPPPKAQPKKDIEFDFGQSSDQLNPFG